MPASADPYQKTIAGSVHHVARKTRARTHAQKLLKALAGKTNILVTTHQYPDPDALASSLAMTRLLEAKLPAATVSMAIKGSVRGGINEMFVKQSNLKLVPWDDDQTIIAKYDAIILLDAQPMFAYSPLPTGCKPTAIIDHHRSKGGHEDSPFHDIRTDVGATTSIVFSYFLELEVPIARDLAALMLYAIESDLSGAAGTPSELDNVALSSLTLLADTRKLYQMRYYDLPQGYFNAYALGMANAVYFEHAIISHLDEIDSMEKPALIADVLLRFEPIRWALVTAAFEGKLVISMRTREPRASAADLMRKLIRNLGEGGGHRTKAGGMIKLETGSSREIDRTRTLLKRRFLRLLSLTAARAIPLIHKPS